MEEALKATLERGRQHGTLPVPGTWKDQNLSCPWLCPCVTLEKTILSLSLRFCNTKRLTPVPYLWGSWDDQMKLRYDQYKLGYCFGYYKQRPK